MLGAAGAEALPSRNCGNDPAHSSPGAEHCPECGEQARAVRAILIPKADIGVPNATHISRRKPLKWRGHTSFIEAEVVWERFMVEQQVMVTRSHIVERLGTPEQYGR